MHYYNDHDKTCCRWLKELIAKGLLPAGDVDDRSIKEVQGSDLVGYEQYHWFAGVGGWPLALESSRWNRLAGAWTGSCPCFTAGAIVLTARGYVPIEQVVVGDSVLTHMGRWQPVTHVGTEFAECVMLKGQGHWGLECTPSHPFLSYDGGSIAWRPASEVVGKRWASVSSVPSVPCPRFSPTTNGHFFSKALNKIRVQGEKNKRPVHIGVCDTAEEAVRMRTAAIRRGCIDVRGADGVDIESVEFARFLGYWLGDGWTCRGSVVLCGAKADCGFLNEMFASIGLKGRANVEKTSSRIRCGSKSLSQWLNENFGSTASGKTIPAWLYGMPPEYRQSFLVGYFEADGHVDRGGKGAITKRFTTASRSVAVGVRVLLNQFGISVSIRHIAPRGKSVIEGRVVNNNGYYLVVAYGKSRSFKFGETHGWGLVRSISRVGVRRVYNLAVEGDESYTVDGIVVHNCQPFSSAGKRKGVADERHLWPEFARLIDERKPPVVFGEQVASKAGRDWLSVVRADLEAMGYVVGAADLCGASVGAPHIRQRLYWGGWLADTRCPHGNGRSRAAGLTGNSPPIGIEGSSFTKPCSSNGWLADTHGGISGDGHLQRRGEHGQQSQDGLARVGLGNTDRQGSQERECHERVQREAGQPPERKAIELSSDGVVDADSCRLKQNDLAQQAGPAASNAPWRTTVHVLCRDGKARPVEPGVRLLVDGFPNRVGLLRGMGNAIIPQVATAFVDAFMDSVLARPDVSVYDGFDRGDS